MQNNLDRLIELITSHPLFVRLKDVIEHAEGWHDHEPVFDHLVKTANIAKEQANGGFIMDSEAKKLFEKWMNEEIGGMKRKDLAILIALLHDCGKILSYREDNKVSTLITSKPILEGQTLCPGHEYWGGEIVAPEILKELGIGENIIDFILQVIKFHDALGYVYLTGKENWPIEALVNDIKSRAEGLYKESMFNMYCDGYTAKAFEAGKKRLEEVFNTPSLYIPRTYFIP